MKNVLIIYHKEDNDGVFSCAICAAYLRKSFPDVHVDCLPSDYASLAKLTKEDIDNYAKQYDNVIMTDVSFNDIKMMQYLYNKFADRLTWIDHHKPAIQASLQNGYDKINGERETGRSAILLAYKYFFDPLNEKYANHTAPDLFRVLSAWDSFTYGREGYSLDFVRDVNKGVTEYFALNIEDAFEEVMRILEREEYTDVYQLGGHSVNMDIKKYYDDGKKYNEYDDRRLASIIENDGDFTWVVSGRPTVAIFNQGHSSSVMFKSAEGRAKHGIVFKHRNDGRWVVSLYNIETADDNVFHCGDYLKMKYNGGGHAGAAGCTLTQDQFIEILKNRSL